jgi:hypothetical protein
MKHLKKYVREHFAYRIISSFTLGLLSLILLASCGKGSDDNIPDGTVQYKVNGELVTIQDKGSNTEGHVSFRKDVYYDQGVNYKLDAGNRTDFLLLRIPTDSLTTQTYTFDSAASRIFAPVQLDHNNLVSGVLYGGDYITVSITSYENGYVSGRFNAKLTHVSVGGSASNINTYKGTIVITDGQFKHLRCNY